MRIWLATSAVPLAPVPAQAATYAARLHWRPSADPSITDYGVYHRTGVGDLALERVVPAAAATMPVLVAGLDSCADHGFALTAYDVRGNKSAISNEVILGYATGTAPGACTPVPCAQSPSGDGGTPHPTRLVIRRTRRGFVFVVRTSFRPRAEFDWTTADVHLVLRDAARVTHFATNIPHAEFERTGSRAVYRTGRRGATRSVHLALRRRHERMVMRARVRVLEDAVSAIVLDTRGAGASPTIEWAVVSDAACVNGVARCDGNGPRCR